MQSFGDILRQVFDAIWAHRLRSFLTMFGIAWGVASLLLLIGLGEGFRSGNTRSLESIGSDVIFLYGGNVPALPNQHQGMRPYKLTLADFADIRSEAPDVGAATAVSSRDDLKEVSAFSSAGGKVMGVQPPFSAIRNVTLEQGRFLDDEDLSGRRQVAVLGKKTSNLLFPQRLTEGLQSPVGQYITVNGMRFLVVGVAGWIGRGNNDGDNQKTYIPLSTMMENFPLTGDNNPQEAVAGIQYQPVTPDLNETAKAEVHAIIARNHGFDPKEKDAFEEWDTIKNNRMIGLIFTAMDIFLGGVGVVTLALGAIGIVNIMLVNVSERTREIGLRKALGATNTSIMLQFFVEGLILTGLSGAIGIAGAAGLMAILNQVIGTSMPGFDPPHLVPWSAALAFGTLTLCGVVAGVFPARQAAMLEPVEALRRD